MKSSTFKYLLTLALVISSFFCTSCEDVEDTEYTIKIISYKGSFGAWYSINDGDYIFINASDIKKNLDYYHYTKKIKEESLDFLKIHADAEGKSVTYIEVEVYKNDDRVASRSRSQNEPDTTISITCEYNPEPSSEDDDSD